MFFITIGYQSGRPRKLTSKKHCQIGMIIKHNHFTTASEMKAQLKEKNPELEVSERTIRRELKKIDQSKSLSCLPRFQTHTRTNSVF